MSFTIVAGISSTGKSTYIDQIAHGCRVMGNETAVVDGIPPGGFLHYNTLRYADNKLKHAGRTYLDDPLLRSIVASGAKPDVIYLFCERQELLGRIAARTTAEDGTGFYPRDDIEPFVRALDHGNFHRRWLALFESFASSMLCVRASNGIFTPVGRDEVTNAAPAEFHGEREPA